MNWEFPAKQKWQQMEINMVILTSFRDGNRFKIYLNLCITVNIHEYFASPAPKNEYRIHWEGMRKER